MFNIPTIKFPRFSLRFFIYFLFGLALLILLAEGGYYFWITKFKKDQKTAGKQFPAEGVESARVEYYQEGMFGYMEKAGKEPQLGIIIGQVQAIEGRSVFAVDIDKKTADSVEIIASNDAKFYIFYWNYPLDNPRDALAGIPGEGWSEGNFNDIEPGDVVEAGGLVEINKKKFRAASFLVIKPKLR